MSAPVPAALRRICAILRTPAAGWRALAADPPAPRAALIFYAAPLAALAAFCPAIGRLAFGEAVLSQVYRPPVIETLVGALLAAIFSVAGLAALAAAIAAIAERFEGKADYPRALALCVFAAAPAFLAGIPLIVPALWPVAFAGLYAVVLLRAGLAPMMRCPPDRAGAFCVVAVTIALTLVVLFAAIGGLARQLI